MNIQYYKRYYFLDNYLFHEFKKSLQYCTSFKALFTDDILASDVCSLEYFYLLLLISL